MEIPELTIRDGGIFMGKAILAFIVTVIVGFFGTAYFANFANAPEWGIVLAVAVMGAFIIFFSEKRS